MTRVLEWKLNPAASHRALVVLPGELKHPCGISFWLHSAVGSPEDHLQEASTYAANGCICVLPDAPYSKRRLGQGSRGPDNSGAEARLWRQNAWELSSLFDRLQSEFAIDTARSFAVGFNLGGSQIARWLKDDVRIRRAVIAGSVPVLSRFWLESTHPLAVKARSTWPETLAGFAQRTRELDLIESVNGLSGAQLLFQYGLQDEWIDAASVDALSAHLRARHHIEWLNDDHDMAARATQRRRRDWLTNATNQTPILPLAALVLES